ncbi:MAG: hypothetical protein U5K70_06445 [Halodesulfurarchaeum sp.]|nr:hypothetical protein [Halodesulfurarchaeum sp.]
MDTNATRMSDVPVFRERTESGMRIVADLGAGARDATVDVLEDVAIVVLENGERTSQFEMDLPESGVANTFITNGVLTIEVNEA